MKLGIKEILVAAKKKGGRFKGLISSEGCYRTRSQGIKEGKTLRSFQNRPANGGAVLEKKSKNSRDINFRLETQKNCSQIGTPYNIEGKRGRGTKTRKGKMAK